MNVELKKIQTTLIVVLALLLIGLLAYFFFVIQPLKHDVADKERELALEEEVLASIENSQEDVETYEDHEIHALLRTLPVYPWIDHWMLDLEKAELISNTEISRYTFAKGMLASTRFTAQEDDVEGDSEEEVVEEEENNVVVEVDDEFDLESEDTISDDNIVVLGDDEEVNQVTANMSVSAESYEELFQFLYEIENLDRFTEIYALSFAAPSEAMILLDQEEETSSELLFDVNVSTYYLEDLVDTFGDYKPSRPFIEPEIKSTPVYQNP